MKKPEQALRGKGNIRLTDLEMMGSFQVIPDLGCQIPNPYFIELSDKFLVKKFNNSFETGPNFSLYHFKNKIMFNFVKSVATRNGMTTNFFHPSLLLWFLDPVSEIRNG